MVPLDVLARFLYAAHPVIYRSWDNADQSVRIVYERQAQVVIDNLGACGFRIVPDQEDIR